MCAAVTVLGTGAAAHAAGFDGAPRINPHAWKAADDEDLAAGLAEARTDAERGCRLGLPEGRHREPAVACFHAYEQAYARGQFERAMQYAAIGCRVHADPASCRRVGALPLRMGNAGIAVPAVIGEEVRRIADFVCLSGVRFRSLVQTDVTGLDCSYLARRFMLARDEEYARALEPQARAFFEGIYEPARAVRLYRVACQRWGYAHGCVSADEIGRRIDERDLAQGYEILEREAGERLVRADVTVAGLAYEGALAARRFEDALRYAVIGCETHRNADLCRAACVRLHHAASCASMKDLPRSADKGAPAHAGLASSGQPSSAPARAIDVEDADLGTWFRAAAREWLSERRAP